MCVFSLKNKDSYIYSLNNDSNSLSRIQRRTRQWGIRSSRTAINLNLWHGTRVTSWFTRGMEQNDRTVTTRSADLRHSQCTSLWECKNVFQCNFQLSLIVTLIIIVIYVLHGSDYIRRLGNHVERSAKRTSYEKSFLTLTFAITKANKFHTAMCAEIVLCDCDCLWIGRSRRANRTYSTFATLEEPSILCVNVCCV